MKSINITESNKIILHEITDLNSDWMSKNKNDSFYITRSFFPYSYSFLTPFDYKPRWIGDTKKANLFKSDSAIIAIKNYHRVTSGEVISFLVSREEGELLSLYSQAKMFKLKDSLK